MSFIILTLPYQIQRCKVPNGSSHKLNVSAGHIAAVQKPRGAAKTPVLTLSLNNPFLHPHQWVFLTQLYSRAQRAEHCVLGGLKQEEYSLGNIACWERKGEGVEEEGGDGRERGGTQRTE